MSKHTKGPWTVEEYGDDETPTLVIHEDSESRICFMATPGSHGDPAKIEADARLIAAAPCMYEALKAVIEHLSDPEISFPPALHDQITTALHKAQTES